MEKMKFESTALNENKKKILMDLFPECVREKSDANGKIIRTVDFDALKSALGIKEPDDSEKYEFSWVGKHDAIVEANKRIRMTLRPDEATSVDWNNTENIYIEGDNLMALKLLQESYLGAVKVIYIDPPYNTGHDFIYPDSFMMDEDEYNNGTGYFDEDGNVNFQRENSQAEGRYHSDWCSMIYSRLLLARNLLREDGAIFISIDDNEVTNLKKICDEIFGEANFAAMIPWRKRTAKSDVPFGISQDYEQILCYAKSSLFEASIEGKERKYYVTDDFPDRPWRIHDLTKQTTASERPNSYFTIVNPKNGQQFPANPNATWRITVDTFDEYYHSGRIVFPGDYPFLNISKPVLRYWKEDDQKKAGDKFGRIALSTKLPDDIGMSQDGTKEIQNLFGSKVFNFPKPTSLIKYLLSATTSDDDIIMDFFSGSGTTADAVMQLNEQDGGRRKFILVQLDEAIAEKTEASKAGFKNICELAKQRIVLAGKKIGSGDVGFRVFKVDSTNMNEVYYSPAEYNQDLLAMMESNIKADRTNLDLLFGCILEWGMSLSLSYSSETIDGFTVHNYNDGDLIACFDENIPDSVMKAIAKLRPRRAVFRDSSFANSPSKINVGEIFKLMAPDTTVKVI